MRIAVPGLVVGSRTRPAPRIQPGNGRTASLGSVQTIARFALPTRPRQVGVVAETIARRPAVAAAAPFIVGIALHQLLPHRPLLWLVLLALLLLAAFFHRRRTTVCSLLLVATLLCAGVTTAQIEHFYYAADHISAFTCDEPQLADIEVKVAETPRLQEPPPAGRPLPGTQIFEAEARRIETIGGWTSASGRLRVSISPPVSGVAAGQVLRIFGMLERPPPAMNPGGFDVAAQERRRRVLATMRISRPYDVRVVSQSVHWDLPVGNLRAASRRLVDKGFDHEHDADRALLRALVFGDREPAVRQTQDDFSHSGTAHLFSANGARVALFGGCVYLLSFFLRLRRRWAVLLIGGCVVALGLLTMPAAQAIRPIVACIAVAVAVAGRRTADPLQVLALAAIALLLWSPLDLYAAGFQLSFAIVLGLLLFTTPLTRWLRSLIEDPDRKVAKPFLPHTTRQRCMDWVKGKMLQLIAAALVAWAVAIPLVAVHFEQFNSWTVPFSLLLAPLALAAAVAGFLKVGLTAACPPLAPLWAAMAQLPAGALRHAVHWLAKAPLADLPVAAPPLWQILIYYTLLCLPLLSWRMPRIGRCMRWAPLGGCLMLALPLAGALSPNSGPFVRVTLLSVGAGQCAVVERRGGDPVIIDAGSSTSSDPLRTCIAPFLRHERVRSIDTVWLSHGDFDHISAARQIVDDYSVRTVVTSPHFRKHAADSKPCEALLAALDQSQHPPKLSWKGDRSQLCEGVGIEVLWPPQQSQMNSNNTGRVLRLTVGGRSILFPADIQEAAERELLKHPERLRSDVLVAPHHGSREATTAEFIRAVDPKFIVSSNGSRLTMKQRLFDQEVAGRRSYRTSRFGALTVEFSANGEIRLTPFHGQPLTIPPP